MVKSIIFAIFAGLAISVQAGAHMIKLAIGADVTVWGPNDEPISGPAILDYKSVDEDLAASYYFQPTIIVNNLSRKEVTLMCGITQKPGVKMADDRIIVIQSVEPYAPIAENGAVQFKCKVAGTYD